MTTHTYGLPFWVINNPLNEIQKCQLQRRQAVQVQQPRTRVRFSVRFSVNVPRPGELAWYSATGILAWYSATGILAISVRVRVRVWVWVQVSVRVRVRVSVRVRHLSPGTWYAMALLS